MSESYELVKFVDGSFELEVNVSPEEDTVWLTQEQMASLFDVDQSRISRHITAIYRDEELDKEATYAENALVQVEGQRRIKRRIQLTKQKNSYGGFHTNNSVINYFQEIKSRC